MVTFSFYTMHLSVQFNHFNCAHWVAVRCEASGASEATPTVAEASEARGSYLYLVYSYTLLTAFKLMHAHAKF